MPFPYLHETYFFLILLKTSSEELRGTVGGGESQKSHLSVYLLIKIQKS